MRTDLQQILCIGCGEIQPQGLIATVMHSCPKNQVNYFGGARFSFRQLANAISGIDVLQPFKDLLKFEHFNAMPDFENASTIDKILFSIARDSDIRTMKSLRKYIFLEDELDSKW